MFSAFASSTWWLLVAAFALGFGMQKSGLMARMAAAVLRIFPNTFNMQAAGLIATGTLVGPFIPSLSAKATMLAPLSMGISDSLGYERKGRQATGLFLAMFTGIRTVGPAVISSSIIGYGLLATLPADVAAQFPMANWFLCMLPWFAFVMIANYVAIVLMFGPGRSKARSKPASASPADGASAASAKKSASRKIFPRTPMASAEKRMAAIMGICVLLWVTEPLHAVPSHIVAIAAMVAMLAFGVVDAKQLRQGIAWDSLIFIGCVLGLADVFAALGIDRWIDRVVHACIRRAGPEPLPVRRGNLFGHHRAAVRHCVRDGLHQHLHGLHGAGCPDVGNQSVGHRRVRLCGGEPMVRAVPEPHLPERLLRHRRQDGEAVIVGCILRSLSCDMHGRTAGQRPFVAIPRTDVKTHSCRSTCPAGQDQFNQNHGRNLIGGNDMSKYDKLWNYVANSGKDELELSFDDIERIGGVPIDHSFLNYKKELLPLGYEVEHIYMKKKLVRFKRA